MKVSEFMLRGGPTMEKPRPTSSYRFARRAEAKERYRMAKRAQAHKRRARA